MRDHLGGHSCIAGGQTDYSLPRPVQRNGTSRNSFMWLIRSPCKTEIPKQVSQQFGMATYGRIKEKIRSLLYPDAMDLDALLKFRSPDGNIGIL